MILFLALLNGNAKVSAPKRVTITVYHDKYHGRHTANGEVYSVNKLSVAVPATRTRRGYRPVIPFGTYLTFTYNGRKVTAKVNDVCPAGTYDLSKLAMTKLLGRYIPTKIKGSMIVYRKDTGS